MTSPFYDGAVSVSLTTKLAPASLPSFGRRVFFILVSFLFNPIGKLGGSRRVEKLVKKRTFSYQLSGRSRSTGQVPMKFTCRRVPFQPFYFVFFFVVFFKYLKKIIPCFVYRVRLIHSFSFQNIYVLIIRTKVFKNSSGVFLFSFLSNDFNAHLFRFVFLSIWQPFSYGKKTVCAFWYVHIKMFSKIKIFLSFI